MRCRWVVGRFEEAKECISHSVFVFVGAAERGHQRELEGKDKEAEGARGEVSALQPWLWVWMNAVLHGC